MIPSIPIFLVEDDPELRQVLEFALEEGGYEITSASDSAGAMTILEGKLLQFRALITDINLPPDATTGWDIAKRAREMNPELPVIYITGGHGHDWASRGVPNSVLLPKPFALAQIVTAVSQLLNATGSTHNL